MTTNDTIHIHSTQTKSPCIFAKFPSFLLLPNSLLSYLQKSFFCSQFTLQTQVCIVNRRSVSGMDDRKEKTEPWLSVPQFGDWDQKGVMPDYSMDFSKIRENRKQNKRDLSRASLGNEEELISSTNKNANTGHHHSAHSDDLHFHQNHSPTRFKPQVAHILLRVYRKQPLYLLKIGVSSAYTHLPSLTFTLGLLLFD
uniref:Uncharacterized protein isoform X2 n=1 Tax=Nicotiana tabacum TaxID=4097 RepID=A0A1S4ACH2_TOBAC|nr:PREDICTED: uncharacterized protein LOC107796146 isoform X2 [Nicotiana tabacum]